MIDEDIPSLSLLSDADVQLDHLRAESRRFAVRFRSLNEDWTSEMQKADEVFAGFRRLSPKAGISGEMIGGAEGT